MFGKILNLSSGLDGIFIENSRFNTTVVSVNFYLPLKFNTIAPNALFPYILTSCSKEYRDFSELNFKLNMLYGADLVVSSEKVLDMQRIKIAVSVINDEYSIGGKSVINEAMDLLISLIFNPKAENNAFFESDVERERRKLLEHIAGEINEKRVFAKNRLLEIMFENSPYGISKYGTENAVKEITAAELYNAWLNMLNTAYVRVQVIGKKLPAGVFERISEEFSKYSRKNIVDYKKVTPVSAADCSREVIEHYDVTQGKLVMGFSSEVHGDNAYNLSVMADVFGGGPYSRLFENVREKMGLCYYCSASAIKSKGLILVQSGVESENAQKAHTEILRQLDYVKNGDFSDFAFGASLKAISGSLLSYNDSLGALDQWYSANIINETLKSPEQVGEMIKNVTKEDVIKAASGVKLHTVYKLLPKKAGGCDEN